MFSPPPHAPKPQRIRYALPLLASLLPACSGDLAQTDQGNLQPQAVRGPCQVKKFFILDLRSAPTDMTVGNVGQACRFTVFNADLQIVLTNALVTEPPSHGQATASLITLGRQAEITYTPQPGYTGPDRFSVTLEPYSLGITLKVAVQAAAPAS